MPGIAFFDVDRTLIDANSAALWVKRELREGRVSYLTAMRAAGWTLLYELGFVRIERAIEDAVRTLQGGLEAELAAQVEVFFADEILPRVRPGAAAALHRHQGAGEPIALLTSSSNYVAAHLAEAVGAAHILSNAFETDDNGRFTGDPVRPLCYGAGKLLHAERLAAELGVTLEDCAFYTDSYSDLPVLERVGRPVAVHPDPRLRRLANQRGWPIERWDNPA